jgi:hypothetical protein
MYALVEPCIETQELYIESKLRRHFGDLNVSRLYDHEIERSKHYSCKLHLKTENNPICDDNLRLRNAFSSYVRLLAKFLYLGYRICV